MVTGVPRSGTSLTAGVIHVCGAWGGEMFAGNKDNPKGFFENKELRQNVVKPYLRENGWDEYGQNPLPPRIVDPEIDWYETVMDVIEDQGYFDGQWFYKCAKAILMWQVWEAAFPDMLWVIVRRPAMNVARSCLKTRFMRAYNTQEDWLLYAYEHEARFTLLKEATKGRVFEVWPGEFVEGNTHAFISMIEHVGLTWNAEGAEGLVIKEAWHHG